MKKNFLTLSFVLFIIPIGISQDLPSYVPTDGLLAYYPFNGNANDESGNGNHGTVNGATLTFDRNDVQNSSYMFENNNIYIENQFYNNGFENYTINIWFLTNSPTKTMQCLLNTIPHDGEGIGYNHENALNTFSHGKNSNVSQHLWDIFSSNPFGFQVQQNVWYMLTIIKNSSDYSYYVNNSLEKTSTASSTAENQNTGLTFGSTSLGSEYINGKLDDIGIWNRALSEEEIQNLYTSSTGDILFNGVVSAENNQIINVADPTEAQGAATKNYVDSNINSFSGSYNDLTDKPMTYTQSQVDALIEGLQNQINELKQITVTTEISFETLFDLETGEICDEPDSMFCDSRFDLRFPYGGGDIKARLWWNESDVDVAFVYDKSFSEIQFSDVSSYYFCEHINDPNQACSDTDSPPTNFIGLYHTSEGNYYAVEYINENLESFKVSFRYKLLQ